MDLVTSALSNTASFQLLSLQDELRKSPAVNHAVWDAAHLDADMHFGCWRAR